MTACVYFEGRAEETDAPKNKSRGSCNRNIRSTTESGGFLLQTGEKSPGIRVALGHRSTFPVEFRSRHLEKNEGIIFHPVPRGNGKSDSISVVVLSARQLRAVLAKVASLLLAKTRDYAVRL